MTYLSAGFSFWQLLLRKEYMIEPPILSYIVKEPERNKTSESGYLERNAMQTVKIVYVTSYNRTGGKETNKGNVTFLLLYKIRVRW